MQDMEVVTDGVAVAPKMHVCKAKGCYEAFPVVSRGGGGRKAEYCSPACRVRASRNGKATSAWEKVIEIEGVASRIMSELREVEAKMTELAMLHSLVCDSLEVAQRQNVEERMEDYTK